MSEQEKVQDYVKKSHNVKGNKPKSEKNTQDVQKNCSSLTEKWNGEIKDYWYYYTESGIEQAHYCEVNGIKELVMPEIEEVLAPVPSYEEWHKINQLLGKCYRFLRLTETKVEAIEKVKRGLVKEIDEVLE